MITSQNASVWAIWPAKCKVGKESDVYLARYSILDNEGYCRCFFHKFLQTACDLRDISLVI